MADPYESSGDSVVLCTTNDIGSKIMSVERYTPFLISMMWFFIGMLIRQQTLYYYGKYMFIWNWLVIDIQKVAARVVRDPYCLHKIWYTLPSGVVVSVYLVCGFFFWWYVLSRQRPGLFMATIVFALAIIAPIAVVRTEVANWWEVLISIAVGTFASWFYVALISMYGPEYFEDMGMFMPIRVLGYGKEDMATYAFRRHRSVAVSPRT